MHAATIVPVAMTPSFVYQASSAPPLLAPPKNFQMRTKIPPTKEKKRSCCCGCVGFFATLLLLSFIFGGALYIFKIVHCAALDYGEAEVFPFSKNNVNKLHISADYASINFFYEDTNDITISLSIADSSAQTSPATLTDGTLAIKLTGSLLDRLVHCIRASINVTLPLNFHLDELSIAVTWIDLEGKDDNNGLLFGDLNNISIDEFKLTTEKNSAKIDSIRAHSIKISSTVEIGLIDLYGKGSAVGQCNITTRFGSQSVESLIPSTQSNYRLKSVAGQIKVGLAQVYPLKATLSTRGGIEVPNSDRFVLESTQEHSKNYVIDNGTEDDSKLIIESETGKVVLIDGLE
ncbi:hypothetical protein RCL1_000961 [Eukaryota sp. TZLM3-RCL]